MTARSHTAVSALTETQVRIGDLSVTASADERLVTVGLGSCIGVAIVDLDTGAAGLAHVFLPAPPPTGPKAAAGAGTYAETAVPELVKRVARLGGPRNVGRGAKLAAVIAGGARMFASRPGTADVGERNIAAVQAALDTAGITVIAADVGGSHGRTMRVTAGADAAITVRQVGSEEQILWAAANTQNRAARAA